MATHIFSSVIEVDNSRLISKIKSQFNVKKWSVFFFICLFGFFQNSLAQAPPTCTTIIELDGWTSVPSTTVSSGEVYCIKGTGTLSGSVVVRSGAALIMCGTGTVHGSVNINSGADYWRTSSTGFSGSFTMAGTEHVHGDNCNDVLGTSCPDTAITQPGDVCIGLTEDLSAHEAGDAGYWSITNAPAGSNPAIITGAGLDVFNASASSTDPGIYTVTFKVDVIDVTCDSISSRTIVVNSNLDAGSIGTAHTVCNNGDPSTLTSTSGAGGGDASYVYEWFWSANGTTGWTAIASSNSAAYNPPTGLTADRWYQREVSSCGQSDTTATVKVTVNGALTPGSIGTAHTICNNTDPSNLTDVLSASGGNASYAYQWYWSENGTTGWNLIVGATSAAFNPSTNLTADRWYQREVSSCGQSDTTATIKVTVNVLPTVTDTTSASRCGGGTVTLGATTSSGTIDWYDALTGGAYEGTGTVWLTGSLSSTTTYYAEAISAEGCTSAVRLPAIATINDNPMVNLPVNQSICKDDSLTLDAGAGYDYLWLPNGEIVQKITVDTAAIYKVVITDGFGCTASDSIILSIDTLPFVFLGNDTSICINQTIDFRANEGYSYSWSPNGEITSSILGINTSGVYRVLIEDGNECKGKDSLVLTIDTLPIVKLGNDTAICFGDSLIYNAGAGYIYAWNPNTETTPTITVKTQGTYAVSITDGNGCIGVGAVDVIVDTIPNLFLGNDTSICESKNLTLDAGANYAYIWSPNGEVSQSITVDTVATYLVLIIDGNGCERTDSINVSIDTLPIVTLGNDTSICIDSTLRLDAGLGVSWFWSTTELTQDITISTSGEYRVTVIDGNGCIGRDTIALSINGLPIVELGSDTSICLDSLIVLDAGNNTASWLWNTTQLTQSISTNLPNTYDVVVTDINGCVGYDTLVLSIDTIPVVFLGNDTSICADSTLLLNAGNNGAASYVWNDGANSKLNTVSTTNVYDVMVTTIKGCVGYDTIMVSINELPIVALGGDSSLCTGDSMVIYGGLSDVTYLWNPTNETSDSIIVNSLGTYDVIVTDTNNCVSYDTIKITVDVLPIVSLGIDSSLCAGDSMLINAVNTNASFLWNTLDTTQTLLVQIAGEYILVVTNDALCSAADSVTVTVDSLPIINLGNDTVICNLDSIIFNAGNAGASFDWSTNSNNQFIQVRTSGEYMVTVTNSYLCSTHDTVNLDINTLPNVELGEDREVCRHLNLGLGVEEEGANYVWNNGTYADSISTNLPGTYYIDVVDTNNCFKTDTIVLTSGPDLVIDLGDNSNLCTGDDVNITVDVTNSVGALSYDWSTSSTGNSINVSETGNYSVIVIDANGCWGEDEKVITLRPLPIISLIADTNSMCSMDESDDVVRIRANYNGDYVEWGTGEIADEYVTQASGFFEAVTYSQYGCESYDTITIAEYCRPVRLTFPNVYTPNEDGINDLFVPFELSYEDEDYLRARLEHITFKVYNRWGISIYSISKEVIPKWNGYTNKGYQATSGTYYWVLEYKMIDSEVIRNNGFVELIR